MRFGKVLKVGKDNIMSLNVYVFNDCIGIDYDGSVKVHKGNGVQRFLDARSQTPILEKVTYPAKISADLFLVIYPKTSIYTYVVAITSNDILCVI